MSIFPPYLNKCTYITFYLSDICTVLLPVQWKGLLLSSPSRCHCTSTLHFISHAHQQMKDLIVQPSLYKADIAAGSFFCSE